MHIGDQVRFMNQQGEGIVVEILGKHSARVQTEDDFVFEVALDELVPVAREEALVFGKAQKESLAEKPDKQKPKAFAKEGIFVGLVQEHQLYRYYVVNNSDFRLAVSLRLQKKAESYEALKLLVLEPKTADHFFDLPKGNFSETAFLADVVFQDERGLLDFPPERYEWKLKAKNLLDAQKDVPVIRKQGYLKKLDRTRSQKIKHEAPTQSSAKPLKINLRKAPEVLDLHLDKLLGGKAVSAMEASFAQMQAFEKHFHDMRASGSERAVYIHGIGEEKLKKRIEQWLKRNRHLYQATRQADPAVYGSGATEVLF